MTLDTRPVTAAAAPTTRLDALLARIDDPALAEQLRQEMRARDRREFGLVFEHHLPETVELPGLRIQPGRKVRILPKRGSIGATDPTVWTVTSVDGPIAHLQSSPDPDHIETTARAVQDLIAVADFADPIYPGLKLTDRLTCDAPDRPWHTLINAENYHALQALQYTHAGQIDTIYIDPPYNTGNDDWIYADRHVSAEDSFRHSKWLSFMERRLLLAKALLKPTGVIIVAIGDDEHHRLRMLMDQVFGEQNFLLNAIWQGSTKSDARFSGGGVDYMIVYGRSKDALVSADIRWKQPKKGYQEILDAVSDAWESSGHDPAEATRLYRLWLRGCEVELDEFTKQYKNIDGDGQLYLGDNMTLSSSMNASPGLQYPILHPVTGKPVRQPPYGWQFGEALLTERMSRGLILFGADETTYPKRKRLFTDNPGTDVRPSFESKGRRGTDHLKAVLGDARFPFPKDHTVLMRWIGMVTPTDGTVLDFFGGSGSTLEAVLRLNAQDGGTRQCILVTNNEVGSKAERDMRKRGLRDGDPAWEAAGVCEYVTKPRIRTILTGVRPDGSTYPDMVAGNVAMYDLTYEDPLHVELDMAFERVAPMLWLAAGAVGECIDFVPAGGWAANGHYGILTGIDNHRGFIDFLTTEKTVFIVTDDQGQYQQVAAQLPAGCRAVRLYESYLRTFQIGAVCA